LTTIRQPAYDMGKRACELLLQKMKNPGKPEQHMMETKLVVRESTAAPQEVKTDKSENYWTSSDPRTNYIL
ncbi:MAG TPA: hypothetical protein DCS48_09460, partial [Desulfovibrio sp.]|nr:hypothetical protein [Desulfovibrio sp.]